MSIKTQRKPRGVHVTMGLRTMRMAPEDEHRICIETRVKPGAPVVPHNKWVDGLWRDKETGEPVPPPEYGKTYLVDLNIADGGRYLIAHPSRCSSGPRWRGDPPSIDETVRQTITPPYADEDVVAYETRWDVYLETGAVATVRKTVKRIDSIGVLRVAFERADRGLSAFTLRERRKIIGRRICQLEKAA
jgi:hypothetical protein